MNFFKKRKVNIKLNLIYVFLVERKINRNNKFLLAFLMILILTFLVKRNFDGKGKRNLRFLLGFLSNR